MKDVLELQLIFSQLDKISGPCKKIKDQITSLNDKTKALNATLREQSQQRKYIEQLRQIGAQTVKSSSSFHAAKLALVSLKQTQQSEGAATEQLSQKINKQTQQVKALSAAYQSNLSLLKTAQARVQSYGVGIANVAAKEKEWQSRIAATKTALNAETEAINRSKNAQEKLNRLRDNYTKIKEHASTAKSIALTTGVASGGLLLAGNGMVNSAAEREASFTRMQAALMNSAGALPTEMNALKALSEQLGDLLPGTTSDIQDMFTVLTQMGIKPAQILSGVGKAAAYLGTQLKIPYDEAARMAAQIKTATNATDADMMGMMDQIQRMYNAGMRNPDDIVQGFKTITSVMSLTGKTGKEAAMAFEPFLIMGSRAGLAGEQAGGGIRKMLSRTLNAKEIAKANDMLAKNGIKLNFMNDKQNFAGIDNFFAQMEKLKGLSDSTKNSVITKIWGDDNETKQIINAAIEKGKQGFDAIRAELDAQASLQQRVELQLKTFEAIKESASGTWTNLKADIGDVLLPVLKELAESFNTAVQRIRQFKNEHPELFSNIVKVVAVIAVAIALISGLALIFATVLLPVRLLSLGLGFLGISMLPITLLAASLIALGIALYSNWDAIGPVITSLGSVFKNFGLILMDALVLPLHVAIAAINMLINGLNHIPGVRIPKLTHNSMYDWGSGNLGNSLGNLKDSLQGIAPATTAQSYLNKDGIPTALARPAAVSNLLDTKNTALGVLAKNKNTAPVVSNKTANVQTKFNNTFNIQVTNGMDPMQVAKAIKQQLADTAAARDTKMRTSFFDQASPAF